MNVSPVKIISYGILLITISSSGQWSSLFIGTTIFWWGVYAFILIMFLFLKKYYNTSNNNNTKWIRALLIWNVICICRGVFEASNYWEWKNLVHAGIYLLLPLSIYISTNKAILQTIIRAWMKYALPAFLLFLPFLYADGLGQYLMPVGFILLFFPILPFKWKVIVLILTLFIIFRAPDARSNVIKFSASLLFGLLFYFRSVIPSNIFKLSRLLLLILPLALFIIAVWGDFNIFKIKDYLKTDKNIIVGDQQNDIGADTRTGIYKEVISSAVKYKYVWFGRTPARGNESVRYGDYLSSVLNTEKMERFSNEVSVLNIFTWTGIVGVALYFLVFYSASYLAIFKSNNIFIKIIGLNIAFRWAYAWVEDFSNFDLNNLFLWLMIGMCVSKTFRIMTNSEIKLWIAGIFNKSKRRLQYPAKKSMAKNISDRLSLKPENI
jgi:hypothetical protein